MKTSLIGFAGAARSGKDTAASFLVERGWQRKAFADPVRNMLYALNPDLRAPGGSSAWPILPSAWTPTAGRR